jgi:macrolide transport system ATP-binding/permease protein
MRPLRAWVQRVAGILSGSRRERELAEELESHLQLHIDDNIRAGMPPPEARRQALIKFGRRWRSVSARRLRCSGWWTR